MADNIQLPTINQLGYWKKKKKIFPNLAHVAQHFLAVSLGSVSSEREFEVGKLMITDVRSQLLPQNAETLIWLNYNVAQWDAALSKSSRSTGSSKANR